MRFYFVVPVFEVLCLFFFWDTKLRASFFVFFLICDFNKNFLFHLRMLLRTLVVFGLLGILSADTCTNSSGWLVYFLFSWKKLSQFFFFSPCTGAPGQCPQAGFCDPDNNTCVAEDGEIFCGSYGAYLLCADDGVVTQECGLFFFFPERKSPLNKLLFFLMNCNYMHPIGSGKDADCSNNGDCGEKTWESIGCDFPGLSPQNGYVPTTWHCGDYGTRLSCEQVFLFWFLFLISFEKKKKISLFTQQNPTGGWECVDWSLWEWGACRLQGGLQWVSRNPLCKGNLLSCQLECLSGFSTFIFFPILLVFFFFLFCSLFSQWLFHFYVAVGE